MIKYVFKPIIFQSFSYTRETKHESIEEKDEKQGGFCH